MRKVMGPLGGLRSVPVEFENAVRRMSMKWKKAILALLLCATTAWAGEAGVRAAGQPQKSQVVHDLRATRKGDKVTLTWTRPRAIANPQGEMRHLAVANLCRTISPHGPGSAPALQS